MGFADKVQEFKLSKKFKYIYFGLLMVIFPIVIIIYGAMYFGGLWDPVGKVKNVEVTVVNNDIGCPPESNILCLVLSSQLGSTEPINIGNTIVGSIQGNQQLSSIFKWKYESHTEEEAYKSVEDYETWGVMYIPQNFTQNLLSQIDTSAYASPEAQQALIQQITTQLNVTPQQLMTMYDMSKLTQVIKPTINYIYDYAHSYTGMTFVTTYLKNIDLNIKKTVALSLYRRVSAVGAKFSNDFYQGAYLSNYVDIHPLHKFGENFASFLLLIVIYIAAIAATIVYRKYRPFDEIIKENKNSKAILVKSLLGKYGISIVYMLITNFLLCVVLVMFSDYQMEHSIVLSFLIMTLWSLTALCFCSLASNLLPLLPFVGICVIFLVIQLASCGGIVAVEFQPGFWNIGKGLPMYYTAAEMRYLLFNTGGRYSARNVWIVVAWTAVLFVLDIITSLFVLNKVRKQNDSSKQVSSTKKVTPTSKEMENAMMVETDIAH